MNFIWHAYQQGQIAEAKTDAIDAKQQAAQTSYRVRALETQVSHMALACQAMWELLRERTGITEPELLAKMKEVDLRDGSPDGRMTAGAHEMSGVWQTLEQQNRQLHILWRRYSKTARVPIK